MRKYLAMLLIFILCASCVGCTKAEAKNKKVNTEITTIEIKDYDKEGKINTGNSQLASSNENSNNVSIKKSIEIKNNLFEKTYKNKVGKNLNVSIEYPTLQSNIGSEAINKVNDSLIKFGNLYTNDSDGVISEFKQDSNNYPTALTYNLVYNVELLNDKYVSISFTLDSYLGGAHPDTVPMSKTYDLTTGNEITLKDIFNIPESEYKDLITKYVIQQTKEKFRPEDNVSESLNVNMLKENLKPGNFYIKDNNLVIYYYSYDFLAYAAGNQEFSIPLSDIKDKLAIDFSK